MRPYVNALFVCLLAWGLSACPPLPEEFSQYQPVMMSRAQLETSVLLKPARALTNTGKLYQYQDDNFINAPYKGVHVIDNRNPASPQNIAFIQVPGNVDFAVKNQMLYVDNAVDLVTLDISNMESIRTVGRVKNAFPALQAPDNLESEIKPEGALAGAVVVAWEPKR